jgi:hypothetical protein
MGMGDFRSAIDLRLRIDIHGFLFTAIYLNTQSSSWITCAGIERA